MEEPKTILVIEDELPLNKIICQTLITSGFKALCAKDGKEGLSIALKERPDLILLDILMPVMDGISMLKELKKDDWGNTVPVFVLTNLDEIDKATEAISAGAYAYYVKTNWDLANIVKKIKDKLDSEDTQN